MNTITAKVFDGKVAIETYDIRDRIKTFEDACREIKKIPTDLSIAGTGLDETDLKAVISFYKISIIAKALNGDWIPNFSDKNQPKYYPWFEYKEDRGFVLFHVNFTYYDSTNVGSRLCFKSRELAEYAAMQFNKEYNAFLLP